MQYTDLHRYLYSQYKSFKAKFICLRTKLLKAKESQFKLEEVKTQFKKQSI
jgi:hypothetical protein